MNLFRKKTINIFNNEGQSKEKSVEHEENTREIKLTSSGSNIEESNTVNPNPELFRKLIEGTSFDHRKKEKDKKEEFYRENNGIYKDKNKPDKDVPSERLPFTKNIEIKRKFINKKSEKRLENIINEVFKYNEEEFK